MFTTRGRTQRAGLHGAAAQKHANLGVGRSGSRALLDVGASAACDTASSRPGPRFHPRLRTQLSKHLWPAWSCHKGTTCPTLCGQVLPASTQERAGAFGDLWARVSPCDSHFMCPLDWTRSVRIKRYYVVRLGGCFWMRLILELTNWVK